VHIYKDAMLVFMAKLFNPFVIVEPLLYFCVCHETPINKNLKNTNYLQENSLLSLLDTSTNK